VMFNDFLVYETKFTVGKSTEVVFKSIIYLVTILVGHWGQKLDTLEREIPPPPQEMPR